MGDSASSKRTFWARMPVQVNPDALRRLPSRIPGLPRVSKLGRSQSTRQAHGANFSIAEIVESMSSEKNQATPQFPVKLGRAGSFNVKCSSDTISEASNSRASRTLPKEFANLREKYRGVSLDKPEVTSGPTANNLFLDKRMALEKEISNFLRMLPCANESNKSYQINDFNWALAYRRIQEDANKSSGALRAYQIVKSFHDRLATAIYNFEKVKEILRDGKILSPPEMDIKVDNICEQMTYITVGFRGFGSKDISWVPYINDVFQNEMRKVKEIEYKRNTMLTNTSEILKRTEAVSWMISATKKLNYASVTAHAAVDILDAYKSLNSKLPMERKTWFLLAATAFLVAAKRDEPNAVTIPKLVDVVHRDAGVALKVADLKAAELHMLGALKSNIFLPMAPEIASMIILAGGLTFPSVNMRKLVVDLTFGILFRSLLDPGRVRIPPTDQAKAALDVAVEYVFYHYDACYDSDLSSYEVYGTSDPGKAHGNFALEMCFQAYKQRFRSYKIPSVSRAVASSNLSPARNIKA